MSVLEPEDEPADTCHEKGESNDICESYAFTVSVAESFEQSFAANSPLRHLLEDELDGVMHGRDPRKEGDNRVCIVTRVG